MLENVEQIEVVIYEIYLILLRTCREFNSFNSDFHFFPEKQEMITVNLQAHKRYSSQRINKERNKVSLAIEWYIQALWKTKNKNKTNECHNKC